MLLTPKSARVERYERLRSRSREPTSSSEHNRVTPPHSRGERSGSSSLSSSSLSDSLSALRLFERSNSMNATDFLRNSVYSEETSPLRLASLRSSSSNVDTSLSSRILDWSETKREKDGETKTKSASSLIDREKSRFRVMEKSPHEIFHRWSLSTDDLMEKMGSMEMEVNTLRKTVSDLRDSIGGEVKARNELERSIKDQQDEIRNLKARIERESIARRELEEIQARASAYLSPAALRLRSSSNNSFSGSRY